MKERNFSFLAYKRCIRANIGNSPTTNYSSKTNCRRRDFLFYACLVELVQHAALSRQRLRVRTPQQVPTLSLKCTPPKVQTRYINQWRPTEATVGHKLRGVVCGSHRYCHGTTVDLRKSKRSTYVVKSGQRCAAGNLLPLSFLLQIFSYKFVERNCSWITYKLPTTSGCSQVVWRLIWDQEFGSSILSTPTRKFDFL